ncbi:hypothetical protein EVAR_83726_1 [Eumeta japonica]|uniref:Uncharacterized protein n=1 Tax=Eumeta variegata TaxID=151549 RepID=A0A4C1WCY2_EUMVA|nr:hypothetical protein EVAR_83726_1 [Eumeta japonica]
MFACVCSSTSALALRNVQKFTQCGTKKSRGGSSYTSRIAVHRARELLFGDENAGRENASGYMRMNITGPLFYLHKFGGSSMVKAVASVLEGLKELGTRTAKVLALMGKALRTAYSFTDPQQIK